MKKFHVIKLLSPVFLILGVAASSLLFANKTSCYPVYAVNWNDSQYDSKYILSPTTETELSEGDYYIIIYDGFTFDSYSDMEDVVGTAVAFVNGNINTDWHSFYFRFVDDEEKTIDLRDLGVYAGQCMYEWVERTFTNYASMVTETHNYLVSAAYGTYVDVIQSSDSSYYSAVSEYQCQDTHYWRSVHTTDENDVGCFKLYCEDGTDSYPLFRDVDDFEYKALEDYTYLDESENEVSITPNDYCYLYKINQTLAEELAFVPAIEKMHDTYEASLTNSEKAEIYRSTYTTLPYHSRFNIYNSYNVVSSYGTYSSFESAISIDTDLGLFWSDLFDALSDYANLCPGNTGPDFSSANIDADDITIDYDNFCISGFSPFEQYVTITIQDPNDSATYNREPSGETYSSNSVSSETYKNSVIQFADYSGNLICGYTLELSYGNSNTYPELLSSSAAEIEIDACEIPSAEYNLTITEITDYESETTVLANFDGEVRFDDLGDTFEYALVSEDAVSRWSIFYQYLNANVVTFQDSPIFTRYQNADGSYSNISEDSYMVGFFRIKATSQSHASFPGNPLYSIAPESEDNGFLNRARAANIEKYNEYSDSFDTIYHDLCEISPEFESFSIDTMKSNVDYELGNYTTKANAEGLQTADGIALYYDVENYIGTNFLAYSDCVSESITTKNQNAGYDLISDALEFEINFTNTLEEEKDRVDEMFASYEEIISTNNSVDELCKTFIDEFNAMLDANKNLRDNENFWNTFDTYFKLIHRSTTYESAHAYYVEGIAALESIIGE